jgi:hypothetical protein
MISFLLGARNIFHQLLSVLQSLTKRVRRFLVAGSCAGGGTRIVSLLSVAQEIEIVVVVTAAEDYFECSSRLLVTK